MTKDNILRFIYESEPNPTTDQIKERFGAGEEVVEAMVSLIMTNKISISGADTITYSIVNCADVPLDFPSPNSTPCS